MKEARYFYDKDITGELPEEEARHAVRVLRLQAGDETFLMDGQGSYYRAEISATTGHRCFYNIVEKMPQERDWKAHIHLAIAPTKLIDRIEWLTEKATEIGLDELSFLNCQFSERSVVKTERIRKIVVSAIKQSHKAWCPVVNEMTDFKKFVAQPREGLKFICHCYEESDVECSVEKPFLFDVLDVQQDVTVLIGPEGDFSLQEVRFALENGYRSVSLGRSRLRTETAGLVAVDMMQIKYQKR